MRKEFNEEREKRKIIYRLGSETVLHILKLSVPFIKKLVRLSKK